MIFSTQVMPIVILILSVLSIKMFILHLELYFIKRNSTFKSFSTDDQSPISLQAIAKEFVFVDYTTRISCCVYVSSIKIETQQQLQVVVVRLANMLLLSQTKGLGPVQPQVASSEVPIRPQKNGRHCAVIQQLD